MTTDQLAELYDLTVTAEKCVEMQHTGAALSALAKARRMLGEMQKPSEDLKVQANSTTIFFQPGPTTYVKPTANPPAAVPASPASVDIDRTLPPGFEVRQFPKGWYPVDNNRPSLLRYYDTKNTRWWACEPHELDLLDDDALVGDDGYPTESAAYADKSRWLKAAGVESLHYTCDGDYVKVEAVYAKNTVQSLPPGVEWPPAKPAPEPDEPRVTGPHEDGRWDIRTGTHLWSWYLRSWLKRDGDSDSRGKYASKHLADRALATSRNIRRAWAEMQGKKEAGR